MVGGGDQKETFDHQTGGIRRPSLNQGGESAIMIIHDLSGHKYLKTTMIFTRVVNRPASVGHPVLCALVPSGIYIPFSYITRRVGCA
jgi:hypothetical protein